MFGFLLGTWGTRELATGKLFPQPHGTEKHLYKTEETAKLGRLVSENTTQAFTVKYKQEIAVLGFLLLMSFVRTTSRVLITRYI